jgi:hypothetical protein
MNEPQLVKAKVPSSERAEGAGEITEQQEGKPAVASLLVETRVPAQVATYGYLGNRSFSGHLGTALTAALIPGIRSLKNVA